MTTAKKQVVVLISGGGSNLQALLDACEHPDFPAEIAGVISNKPDAYGLTRAENADISTAVLSHKDFGSREAFDEALHEIIMMFNPDIVCLAGFMRLLTPEFVGKWDKKMINVHPSLLPKYKGLHTHQRAIDAGDAEGGCTVHYVVPEMDAGPIIAQEAVPIKDGDTADILAKRVLKAEHKIYVEALKKIALSNA